MVTGARQLQTITTTYEDLHPRKRRKKTAEETDESVSILLTSPLFYVTRKLTRQREKPTPRPAE